MRGTGLRALPLLALALAFALTLSGCPLGSPQLSVTPKAITFGETYENQFLNIQNLGTGNLSWSLDEVARANENAPWTTNALPFLSADKVFGTLGSGIDRVTLTLNRGGLPIGAYANLGVRITSNAGTEIIPLAFVVKPTLTATPTEFTLEPSTTSAEFSVINTGTAAADWDILYLPNLDNLESAVDLSTEPDFRVTPSPGRTDPGKSTPVSVQWGLGRTDFYLLLRSDAGLSILTFAFGSPLEGLLVTPQTLRLYISGTTVPEGETQPEQAISKLRIANTGTVSRSWNVIVRASDGASAVPPISLNPGSGTTASNTESAIELKVTDITRVQTGSGHYEAVVSSGNSFTVVPIVVEIQTLPEIAISESPKQPRPEIVPLDTLDFGRDKVQAEFWVANVGPRTSRLSFKVTTEDDTAETPLIIAVGPRQATLQAEGTDFFFPTDSNNQIDGQAITVTIDRSALKEDVEYHNITITAYTPDFLTPIDAVEPANIQIRVERQPLTIEGATNRARPPFLMRFTFLMRDSLNKAIPTQTAEDLSKISFAISENDVPLDLDETNFFVSGPENLRTNLVLMLDYTGSMYNAGTDSTTAPLAQGEAIQQVNTAALQFIDDLPPAYRVAIMYHNDRQQQNRLIANFTTDRGALRTALTEFSLPATQHGVSTIYDALKDASDRLAAEDAAETLPFDEADVRAVMFITDGRDNSSIATSAEVQDAALNARVRLYPLVYAAGAQTSIADLIKLATETGGHFYNAGDVRNLTTLLGSGKGLYLTQSPIVGENLAYFRVSNVSNGAFNWTVKAPAGVNWIKSITPSTGLLNSNETITVTVQLDPTIIGANTTLAANLAVTTNNDSGEGVATVQASVGANTNLVESTAVDLVDEPGLIWSELRNQLVLTYVTPSQTGGEYSVTATYEQPSGVPISGNFKKDGVFFSGDVRAGQISMSTDGIREDTTQTDPADQVRAEVYVRCDYAPRDVNRFRMRFFLRTQDDIPPAAVAALQQAELQVQLASGGLLAGEGDLSPAWRILAEPDGSYVLLTAEDNALTYGASGNLLKLTFTNLRAFRDAFAGLARRPEFLLEMRVDNDIYVQPASATQPSRTKYFLYPSGISFPDRALSITTLSDLAGPAQFPEDLGAPKAPDGSPLDPEAPFAWDRDEDTLPDYSDPFPDDESRPATYAIPNPMTLAANQDSRTLTIRNEILDTVNFTLAKDPAATWLTLTGATTFSLAPNATIQLTVSVDRTGLVDGIYRTSLDLQTDKAGAYAAEEIPVTMIVSAP